MASAEYWGLSGAALFFVLVFLAFAVSMIMELGRVHKDTNTLLLVALQQFLMFLFVLMLYMFTRQSYMLVSVPLFYLVALLFALFTCHSQRYRTLYLIWCIPQMAAQSIAVVIQIAVLITHCHRHSGCSNAWWLYTLVIVFDALFVLVIYTTYHAVGKIVRNDFPDNDYSVPLRTYARILVGIDHHSAQQRALARAPALASHRIHEVTQQAITDAGAIETVQRMHITANSELIPHPVLRDAVVPYSTTLLDPNIYNFGEPKRREVQDIYDHLAAISGGTISQYSSAFADQIRKTRALLTLETDKERSKKTA